MISQFFSCGYQSREIFELWQYNGLRLSGVKHMKYYKVSKKPDTLKFGKNHKILFTGSIVSSQ